MGSEELSSVTNLQQKNFTTLKEELDIHDTEKNIIDQDDLKQLERNAVVLSEKLTAVSEQVTLMITELREELSDYIIGNGDLNAVSLTLAKALITEMEGFQKQVISLQEWEKTRITGAYAVSTTKEGEGPVTTMVEAAAGNDNLLVGATVSDNREKTIIQATVIGGMHQAQVIATTDKLTGARSTTGIVTGGDRNLLQEMRGKKLVQVPHSQTTPAPEQMGTIQTDEQIPEVVIDNQLPPEDKKTHPEILSEQKTKPTSPEANAG